MLQTRNGKYYSDGIEITAEEYDSLLAVVTAKAKLVDDISTGKASIDDCPEEWKTEIEERVYERTHENTDTELTAEEALEILLGGAV